MSGLVPFFVEHASGLLSAAQVQERLDHLIRSPDHAVAVGDPPIAAFTLIDTCANQNDAAELTLFSQDPALVPALLRRAEDLARQGPRSAIELPLWPAFGPSPHQLTEAGYAFSYAMFTMVREGSPPAVEREPWEDLGPETMEGYEAAVRGAFAEIPGAYVLESALFRARAATLDPKPRLLRIDGRVAAFLRVSPDGEVQSLGRHPDFRRAGLGERILREAMGLLAHTTRQHLEVAARNERALALYERHGFVVQGRSAVWAKRL